MIWEAEKQALGYDAEEPAVDNAQHPQALGQV